MADLVYKAPSALVEHCSPPKAREGVSKVGTYDFTEVKALYVWMAANDVIQSDEEWFKAGMAVKIEFGDQGQQIWSELATRSGHLSGESFNRWRSFSSEVTDDSVTLGTLIHRARAMGWKGRLTQTSQSMFSSLTTQSSDVAVAQLAASVGVTSLPSGLPVPAPAPIPMMAGQAELARLATPILDDFIGATVDAPSLPAASDYPTLPAAMSGHGLFDLMSTSITRIFSLAEQPKFKPARITNPMAVLRVMHLEIYDAVYRRLMNMGHVVPDRKIKLAAENLSEKVERVSVTLDRWIRDNKSNIESDNPDNVIVLLGILGLDLRWNLWLERMEIKGGIDSDLHWPEWTYVDDAIVAKLMTRARQTKTRFRPGKDFMWETLGALAQKNSVDPVLQTLDELAGAWDGTPRLVTWLSRYCGTPCDPYYQAVGMLIIGGMVRRARHPGCKFDFMPIFFGPQGTGKSSMLAIMAFRPEWFTDSILLGDASKELVLSLAGKLVVEIGEMGMRGNTNANHIKAMISRQVDAGRTAYARSVSERKRRNLFAGTTNETTPLEDPTGNRRFLPVPVLSRIDLAAFRADIGQLIGEAATLETQGCTFDLPESVWGIAATYQEAARTESDIEVRFGDWFGETALTSEAFVTVADITQLTMAMGKKNAGQLVRPIMERLGFRQDAPWIGGKRTNVWVRCQRDMKAKHIPSLPRYNVDVSTSGPRVTIRQSSGNVPPG